MKKSALLYTAAASLVMAACSSELPAPAPGGDGNVTFTVTLPVEKAQSRAMGDGFAASALEYMVYKADGTSLKSNPTTIDLAGSLSTTINLKLVYGETYRIVFYAHNPNSNASCYNTYGKCIEVDYAEMAKTQGSVDHDFFYAMEEIKVDGAITRNVDLVRPCAQVNWGTNDLSEPIVGKTYNNGLRTALKATGYQYLDVLTGARSGSVTITGDNPGDDSASKLENPFADPAYTGINTMYVLTDATQTLTDLELQAYNGAETTPVWTVTASNVPVQANYRTNLYGALLTSTADVKVTKDANFGGGHLFGPDALLLAGKQGGSVTVSEPANGNGATVEVLTDKAMSVNNTAGISGFNFSIDGTLTIDGAGAVTAPASNAPLMVVHNGGTLTVENGDFTPGQVAARSGENSDLLIEAGGRAYINGGVFHNINSLPSIVNEAGKDALVIKGGTFYGVDPSTIGTIPVNYSVTQTGDNCWTVCDGTPVFNAAQLRTAAADANIAKIVVMQSFTATNGQESAALVFANPDVTLVLKPGTVLTLGYNQDKVGEVAKGTIEENWTAAIEIPSGKKVTVEGQGTLQTGARTFKVDGGELVINGGTVRTDCVSLSSGNVIWVAAGSLTVNNGVIDGGSRCISNYGTTTINGGIVVSHDCATDVPGGRYGHYAIVNCIEPYATEPSKLYINGGDISSSKGAVDIGTGYFEINGGYLHSFKHNNHNCFYAAYIDIQGSCQGKITGGRFYNGCNNGDPAVYVVTRAGSDSKLQITGGEFADKGSRADYAGRILGDLIVADGYDWSETGSGLFPWKVVKQ